MSNVDDLYSMSDDDLEAAFRSAKAEQAEFGDNDEQDHNVDENLTDVDENVNPNDEINSEAEDEDKGSSSAEKNNDGTEQPSKKEDSGRDVGDKADTTGADSDKGDNVDKDVDPKAESTSAATPAVRKFKANGKEYEITVDEMEAQFPKIFAQAMDYTKKTQAIAPWRKTIDAIEQAKLTHADINLAIDVLKGDKGAIAELLKRTSVDALDLNPAEANYTPNDYGRDSRELALNDVLDTIKADPEYATTARILTTEWDDASWGVLSADPKKIELLHNDVKSGIYAKVQRIAEKQKVFDGGRGTDLDYYMNAAREYYTNLAAQETQRREQTTVTARQEAEAAAQDRIAQAKAQDAQRKASTQAAQARKAAAPSASPTKKSGSVNYLDASEEDFEEWYKRING